MENKEFVELFGNVLLGIVCPFSFLISENPIGLLKNDNNGGKNNGKQG